MQFGATAMVLVLLVGMLVVIGAGVKLYDDRRKRQVEGVHLQAQVSDALLRDPGAHGLAVTPTAHVPWSGTPVRLDVLGRVPAPAVRDRVLRIVGEEARRIRPDVVVVDRLEVDAALPMRAA